MTGHLAITNTALATLVSLGDDLSSLDEKALVKFVSTLQQPDGSFSASMDGGECDMRFVYCACAISTFLGNWSGVAKEKAIGYIRSCITYEGGISLSPGSEAHGGSCYCAVASLALMNRLEDALGPAQRRDLIAFCMQRQVAAGGGYQGRTNKDADSCYSFWFGGTLQILGEFHDSNLRGTLGFLLDSCQNTFFGGFAKFPGAPQDILHSFYSVCWCAMACNHARQENSTKDGGHSSQDGRGNEKEKKDEDDAVRERIPLLKQISPELGIVASRKFW